MTTHGIPTGARVIAPRNINSKERASNKAGISAAGVVTACGSFSSLYDPLPQLPRPSGRGLFAQPLKSGVCAKRIARDNRGRVVSPPASMSLRA